MPTVNIPGVGEIRLDQFAAPAIGVISVIALILGLVFGLKDAEGSSNGSGAGDQTTTTSTTSAEPAPSQPTTSAAAPTTSAVAPTTTAAAPTTTTTARETSERPTLSAPATDTGTPATGIAKPRLNLIRRQLASDLLSAPIENKNMFPDTSLDSVAREELERAPLIDFSKGTHPNNIQEVDLVAYRLDDEIVVYFYRVEHAWADQYYLKTNANYYAEDKLGGPWLKNTNYAVSSSHDNTYHYVAIPTRQRAEREPIEFDPVKAKTGVDIGLRVIGGILDIARVPFFGDIVKQIPTDWITNIPTPTPTATP